MSAIEEIAAFTRLSKRAGHGRQGDKNSLEAELRRLHIRWTYSGRRLQASLFQNSAQLVVASNRLVDTVQELPGADHRLPKNEVVFSYANGADEALGAADAVRLLADVES